MHNKSNITTRTLFASKFRLLNSQDHGHSEEINWSSSDSEYEDGKFNESQFRSCKRKRIKVTKNISTLDVKLLNVSKETNDRPVRNKSPVLNIKSDRCKSPILTCTLARQKSSVNSPILNSRNQKSPIILSRNDSPKVNYIKKKLFSSTCHYINNDHSNMINNCELSNENVVKEDLQTKEVSYPSGNNVLKEKIPQVSGPSDKLQHAKLNLVKNLQNFFDSHFSSENSSQSSVTDISDISTPKEIKNNSEEFEIFTSNTPLDTNTLITSKDVSEEVKQSENKKKMRYKKDGLSYRLCTLLKKHNASISLWQHERYLAENSNFIIPKMEHIEFHIQKVYIKYGCHLIEGVDCYGDHYLILINNCYVSNNILCDNIIRLYKPFKILKFNSNCKLVTNVFKFECKPIINNK